MQPAEDPRISALKASPSYRLAFEDDDFLRREELRPDRVELELVKAMLVQDDHGIRSTIVLFGSARIPEPSEARRRLDAAKAALAVAPNDRDAQSFVRVCERVVEKSRYYEVAREFASLVSKQWQREGRRDLVVCTGGGPGIMEAGNRGAWEAGAKSIGLNVTLPHEQFPNPYITPELCFQFRYFAVRKMHFLMRAKAVVFFPGGFGTMDEMFETLTLVQTGRLKHLPLVFCGREFWSRAIDFEYFAAEGMISQADLGLILYADTAEEIVETIRRFYAHEVTEARTRQVPEE